MASFTVHEVDTELNERLVAEARRRKISKNALVKKILAEHVGLPSNGRYADDYREFVGVWTAEQAEEFSASQAEFQKIDTDEWQ